MILNGLITLASFLNYFLLTYINSSKEILIKGFLWTLLVDSLFKCWLHWCTFTKTKLFTVIWNLKTFCYELRTKAVSKLLTLVADASRTQRSIHTFKVDFTEHLKSCLGSSTQLQLICGVLDALSMSCTRVFPL